MINIVIAEDHNCLIDGIDIYFEFEEDIAIVGKANDGIALLETLKHKHVDVVIVDIRMPRLDGIEATKQIVEKYPHIKVIAFTMIGKRETVNKMIAIGVKGYLLKNASLKILLEAVREVYSGKTYYDSNLSLEKDSTATIKQKKLLTKRQYEILELIGQGLTNKQIGEKLFIGAYTVGTHRKNMIEKLNLKGRNALLEYALNRKSDFD
ncbi:response regulator [Tenacibaculum ovolyticum]|uniref:response regulator n=1 Tax=Tenacibaculum ovolyticum TaxID=104270 RepID=UPI000420C302|nr:response regulator transcription factor [Tenacibaculum ovolyticum]